MVLRISFIVISTTTKQLHQTTVEASCCPTFWLGSDAFTASTSWFNHNLSPPLLKIVARIVRPNASNTRSSTDSTKESTSSITKSDLKICQVACCSVFPRFEICISVINMITQTSFRPAALRWLFAKHSQKACSLPALGEAGSRIQQLTIIWNHWHLASHNSRPNLWIVTLLHYLLLEVVYYLCYKSSLPFAYQAGRVYRICIYSYIVICDYMCMYLKNGLETSKITTAFGQVPKKTYTLQEALHGNHRPYFRCRWDTRPQGWCQAVPAPWRSGCIPGKSYEEIQSMANVEDGIKSISDNRI